MGCSCQGPKAFQIEVNNEKYIVWSLDEAVFSTIFAEPKDEATAEEMLWERLCEFNPELDRKLEFAFKRVLLQIYRDTKQAYQEYQKNQQQVS